MTHTNEVTPEQLDLLMARTTEQVMREAETQRRAEKWPGQVDQTLALLARAVETLTARVADLEAGRG